MSLAPALDPMFYFGAPFSPTLPESPSPPPLPEEKNLPASFLGTMFDSELSVLLLIFIACIGVLVYVPPKDFRPKL